MRATPLILAAALTLSGCGTYVWSQPSASPQMATSDNAECRAEARARAADSVVLGFPQGLPPSRFDTAWTRWPNDYSRDIYGPTTDPAARFEGEHRTYVDCMERHGYTLERLRATRD